MRRETVSSVNLAAAVWRKSSRSGTNGTGACVEVGLVSAAGGVRDSRNQAGQYLVFGGAAWRAFAESVK